MNGLSKIKSSLKKYIWLLYFLKQDPRVSKKAKLIVQFTLAYALSPIDLIPDFIPVLGWIDDLIIVPLGIYWAIKLIPKEVLDDCNRNATIALEQGDPLPKNRVVARIIVLVWLIIMVFGGRWLYLKFF